MKKWSLIVFTILSQTAVGAFWVLMATHLYFSSRFGSVQKEGLALTPLLVIEAIMLSSLLVSLAHLGTPSNAYRAVANFRSSWLSREISFAVLFTLTSGAFTYLSWGQVGSANLRSSVAWLAMIFGFLLVYSMSRLYMLRTVPVWNTLFTLISFFLTALILGGLVVGAVFTISQAEGFPSDASLDINVLVMITTGALLLLGGEFVLVPARVVRLVSGSNGEKETLQKLFQRYKSVFYCRLLMGIGGSAFLFFILLQTRYDPVFYAVCFAFILLAELSDRFLFYAARDVSGI